MSLGAPPQLEGVEHRYITVRGVKLHVAEAGEGPPVILQHGWPQHWWEWRDYIPELARTRRVLCPDIRGFGWSQFPPDKDFRKETIVDDLLGLCAELGIEEVDYVGHDWGAWAGYLLCLRDRHPVKRLMTMSVPPPYPPKKVEPRKLLRLWYQLPLATPMPAGMKAPLLREVFDQARKKGEFTIEELDTYMSPLRTKQGNAATARLYRSFLTKEMRQIAKGKYGGKRLRVPTLFMCGDRDPIYDPDLVALLDENADDVRKEIVPSVGHFLPEEEPELVRQRMLEFLA